MAALRESVPEVHLLGIQPSLVAFGYPVSAAVRQAVAEIHARLRSGASIDAWPRLEASRSASHRETQGEET